MYENKRQMKSQIIIHDLKVECLIGCLMKERRRRQVVFADLELVLAAGHVFQREKIGSTRDYAKIAHEVGFILRAGRFVLLENAALFLLRYLLLPSPGQPDQPKIETARVSLTKLHALPGKASACVTMEARAGEVTYEREITPWGWVDVVATNDRMGLYKLNMRPQGVIANHYHKVTREAEFILCSGVELTMDEKPYRPVRLGAEFHWEKGQCHGYRNVGKQTAAVLCVDEPAFQPADEIVLGELAS